ncbi:hypothetical protein [Microbacterium xanthum]|uniref:hypothetical protein n=1 Tax=Microbacterium xanthum TaxID=3079794 RepID=UPI002AD4F99A|nr:MULTISPECIES: hypothetical protein [unclassified Microbacterium]MDZ8172373.1 hypothetical protein [Microbacterium sp. KSW-48]MDZ8201909.1 hypothetical protein [Microbacterium sp. SSW1-59]
MISTTDSSAPHLSRPTPLRLQPAAFGLWRVVDRHGRILGHLQRAADDGAARWRARRLSPIRHGFLDLGDFWSADDAVECIRYS